MKMNLLHDILRGLEALERKEQVATPKPKQNSPKGFGNLIKVTRQGPAGEPISSDPYAVDYPPQTYDYDPDQVVFFQVQTDSPEHHAKLKDFDMITKCDPTTAHKILTLA